MERTDPKKENEDPSSPTLSPFRQQKEKVPQYSLPSFPSPYPSSLRPSFLQSLFRFSISLLLLSFQLFFFRHPGESRDPWNVSASPAFSVFLPAEKNEKSLDIYWELSYICPRIPDKNAFGSPQDPARCRGGEIGQRRTGQATKLSPRIKKRGWYRGSALLYF